MLWIAGLPQGVIVIPNVLPQPLVQHMNSVIDGACADGIIDDERSSDRFNFAQVAALDPAFMETMASPTTLEVIRVMCGDWLRLDHACTFDACLAHARGRTLCCACPLTDSSVPAQTAFIWIIPGAVARTCTAATAWRLASTSTSGFKGACTTV